MASSNPSYVRLVDRLTNGLVCDLETGWSIAGYDVQPFPEDAAEGAFVRSKLYEGVLEAAGKAEYQEITEANEEIAANRVVDQNYEQSSSWQENVIQRHAKEVRGKLKEARAADAVDADYDPYSGRSLLDTTQSPEVEAERREAAIAEAKELGLDDDDPEVQVARSGGQVPRGAKGRRAKTSPAKESGE